MQNSAENAGLKARGEVRILRRRNVRLAELARRGRLKICYPCGEHYGFKSRAGYQRREWSGALNWLKAADCKSVTHRVNIGGSNPPPTTRAVSKYGYCGGLKIRRTRFDPETAHQICRSAAIGSRVRLKIA